MSPEVSPPHADNNDHPERQIPYREFRDLVKLDLTGKADPRIEAAVRRPEYAVRWWRILGTIRKSLERQNATAKMYLEAHPHRRTKGGYGASNYQQALSRYHKERAQREWVRVAIIERIAEARAAITEQDEITVESLEALTSALIRCDQLLNEKDIDAAQQALRKALRSIHDIASFDASGATADEASD